MRKISIRTAENLYWIGRYLERFTLLAKESTKAFDEIIDINKDAGKELCEKLQYFIEYENATDFFYKISKENESVNLLSILKAARENTIESRDVLSDDLFMPVNVAYLKLKEKEKPTVKFIDNLALELNSFWGTIFVRMMKNKPHSIIEFGQIVERMDFKLRLFEDISMIQLDLNRLNATGRYINAEFENINITHSNVPKAIERINNAIGEIIKYES
jgi:uncharacterized alpha-E superfamily protein